LGRPLFLWERKKKTNRCNREFGERKKKDVAVAGKEKAKEQTWGGRLEREGVRKSQKRHVGGFRGEGEVY